MTKYVFYHGDLDGILSARIYKQFSNEELTFVKYSHYDKRRIKDQIDLIKNDDKAVLLDVTFPKYYFDTVIDTVGPQNIFWIDHHEDPIIEIESHLLVDIPGLRNVNNSACYLTWLYFNKGKDINIPLVVKYVNDYDMWRFNYNRTRAFYYGLEHLTNDVNHEIFDKLLNDNLSTVESIYNTGKIIQDYKDKSYKRNLRKYGYISKFVNNGKTYSVLVTTDINADSFIFGEHIKKFGFCAIMRFDGEGYDISLRSYGDNANVCNIANSLGGKGHKNSAGCRSSINPFPFVEKFNG